MTNPGRRPAITPNPKIHNEPPERPFVRRLTSKQVGIIGTVIVDLILAQTALALGGINILGVKPFDFLTTWGLDLQQRAAQAYNQAMAAEAIANSSTAGQAIAIGEVQVTRGTLQSTVNGLWEANNNTTLPAGTNKTPAELKTSQVTVRQTGDTNKSNIQSTWNNIYEGAFYNATLPPGDRSLTDLKTSVQATATTANGADSKSDTNQGNIQSTWNEIYSASGGTLPGNRSLQDARTQLGIVGTDATNGALNSQSTIDAIYQAMYGSTATNRPKEDVKPALEAGQKEVQSSFQAGSNLMLSPDFEDTAIPRRTIGGVGEYTTSNPRNGLRSWRWAHNSAQPACGLYFAPTRLSERYTVRPATTATNGDWYYVECWFRSATTTGSVRFGAQWFNKAANTQVQDITDTALSNTAVVPVNTWVKFSDYFQVPQGRDEGVFYIQTSSAPNGTIFQVDDVVVREVTDAKEAAAAAALAAGAAETAQQSADDAAAYTDETQLAGSNIVLSPDFETVTVGRLHVGTPLTITSTVIASGNGTGYTTVQKRSGSYSYRWQQAAASATGLYLAPTPTNSFVNVKPGDRFDMSAQVYSSHSASPTGAMRLGVEWLNGATTVSSDYREWTLVSVATSSETQLARNVWKQLTYTTPACPSGANTARFFVYGSSAVATNNFTYVDDVSVVDVTLSQNVADAYVDGTSGGKPVTGAKPSDVQAAADGQATTVADTNTKVTEITAANAQNALAGKAFTENFGSYVTASGGVVAAGTAVPSTFTTTEVVPSGGNGQGDMKFDGAGRIAWYPQSASSLDRSRVFSIYNTSHESSYQRVGAVFSTALPYQTNTGSVFGANYLFARATSTVSTLWPTSCVFAKFFYPDLVSGLFQQAKVELYRVLSGVESFIASATFTYTAGATYWLEAGDPSTLPTTDRRFKVYKDNTVILNATDSLSALGSSNLRSGFGMEPGADVAFRYDPAKVASWAAYDNVPAATLGSGFRATRASGQSTVSITASTSGTTLPNSTFTQTRATSDFTYSTTGNTLTVGVSGWYAVSVGLLKSTAFGVSQFLQAAVFVKETSAASNVLHTVGNQAADFQQSTVNAIVYVAQGGTIQPGYVSNVDMAVSGDDARTYFNVAFLNNTKPVQP